MFLLFDWENKTYKYKTIEINTKKSQITKSLKSIIDIKTSFFVQVPSQLSL